MLTVRVVHSSLQIFFREETVFVIMVILILHISKLLIFIKYCKFGNLKSFSNNYTHQMG